MAVAFLPARIEHDISGQATSMKETQELVLLAVVDEDAHDDPSKWASETVACGGEKKVGSGLKNSSFELRRELR